MINFLQVLLTEDYYLLLLRILRYCGLLFAVNGHDLPWPFFFFEMVWSYHGHFSFRNGLGLPLPFFISQWAWFTMANFLYCNGLELPWPFFISQWPGVARTVYPGQLSKVKARNCEVAANPSSQYWVHSILQVKWNGASWPVWSQGKGVFSAKEVSVELSQFCLRHWRLQRHPISDVRKRIILFLYAFTDNSYATPPSPPLRLRRHHSYLTGYCLRAYTRNRVAMSCLHYCNLCPVTPVPSCSLHSRSATLRQPGQGPKELTKPLRSRIFDNEESFISKCRTPISVYDFKLRYRRFFFIGRLRYRSILWYPGASISK